MAITLRRSLKHSHVEIIQINFTLMGSYHSNAVTDATFDVSLNLYMFVTKSCAWTWCIIQYNWIDMSITWMLSCNNLIFYSWQHYVLQLWINTVYPRNSRKSYILQFCVHAVYSRFGNLPFCISLRVPFINYIHKLCLHKNIWEWKRNEVLYV